MGGLLKAFMHIHVGYGNSAFDFGIKVNIVKENRVCLDSLRFFLLFQSGQLTDYLTTIRGRWYFW